MKIVVIDTQGAGLGQAVIKNTQRNRRWYIFIALGTNIYATSTMIKAGADFGISGEIAIGEFCSKNQLDSIIGPIGIICNRGINREITSLISSSIFNMHCTRYILPLQKHGIYSQALEIYKSKI